MYDRQFEQSQGLQAMRACHGGLRVFTQEKAKALRAG
jgi:hypothetical protein